MSLLDRFNTSVVVYPEITVEDEDGNQMQLPSDVGIPTKANVQLAAQSGTSARNAETNDFGFNTEEVYRIRFPRDFQEIGPASVIDWQGREHGIYGMPQRYIGSSSTTRIEYMMKRS